MWICVCTCVCNVCGGQKKSSDPLELELIGSWELQSGSLEEQQVLPTTEPSLRPTSWYFYLSGAHTVLLDLLAPEDSFPGQEPTRSSLFPKLP